MSYTATTWESGDVVTSAKLNNMENGISSNCLPSVGITVANGAGTIDSTSGIDNIMTYTGVVLVKITANDVESTYIGNAQPSRSLTMQTFSVFFANVETFESGTTTYKTYLAFKTADGESVSLSSGYLKQDVP